MARRMAERFEDDDFFAEPNYDKLSDEELDELYYFGELRSAPKLKKKARKPELKKANERMFDDEEDNWLDVDLDGSGDDDLYDDD